MKHGRLVFGVLSMLFAAGWFIFLEGLSRAASVAVASDLEGHFATIRPTSIEGYSRAEVSTVLSANYERMKQKRMSAIPGLAAMTVGTVLLISWGQKRPGSS
ncbi:MAG TPA: hypothetical protein VFG14_12005 [Chthoniobacteraceae bacterium]|nr:hypothetical protein [Chthoniobacteraceae bacterium]